MIQAVENQLSESLIGLLETFEPHLGSDIEIEAKNLAIIVRSLRAMRGLAINMEREIAVLRMTEDGRAASDALNRETERLVDEALGQSGTEATVVSLDFWRKP